MFGSMSQAKQRGRYMANRRALSALAVMLVATSGVACNIALPTRATPREPLDALWEKQMMEGRGVRMWVDDNWQPQSVEAGRSFTDLRSSHKERKDPASWEFASRDSYGITVYRHVEGYWRNGGWTLTGGPLGVAADAESTIELFGKAVIRTSVHVPSGMLHRDPPTETGYEFFLLRRSQATGAATIIRRWVVQPADVVKDRSGYSRAEAVLRYDASATVAAISITGLKQPVNDRVDVSASQAAQ
jgi:hypothetical protein